MSGDINFTDSDGKKIEKKPDNTPLRIIFLDIDGVLNSAQSRHMFARHHENGSRIFCPLAISNLRWIIRKTKAKIVISSSWRKYYGIDQMGAIFEQYGIGHGRRFDYTKRIWGSTPATFSYLARGFEIKRWFAETEEEDQLDAGEEIRRKEVLEKKRFIILDDDTDMKPYMDRLIKTDPWHGLMYRDAVKAIELFGCNWKWEKGDDECCAEDDL